MEYVEAWEINVKQTSRFIPTAMVACTDVCNNVVRKSRWEKRKNLLAGKQTCQI